MLTTGSTRTRERPNQGVHGNDQTSLGLDIGFCVDTWRHGLKLGELTSASVARNLDPRKVLVHTRFTRKAQHLLAEDVAHDFTRATFDRIRT